MNLILQNVSYGGEVQSTPSQNNLAVMQYFLLKGYKQVRLKHCADA